MEISSNNAFQVIFPKYVDLLSQTNLHADESLESFLRDELPQKIQLVRNIEQTFLAFQTQFTNLILKRPRQSSLTQSLLVKAAQKIQKYFYGVQLKCDKVPKNSLNGQLSFLNLQQIRSLFRQKLKDMQSLIKQKYFQNYGLDRQVQEQISKRLYILLQVYHFTKNDLISVAAKYKVKQSQILSSINSSKQPEQIGIEGLLYLDQGLIHNINDLVSKRCRPFLGKKDFFFNKLKTIMNQSQSKVPLNISLLLSSIVSKQKYRVTKDLTACLNKQLKTIQHVEEDSQRQAKEIMAQVQQLKRQFNQLKNNVYYLDIIRGTFADKYKMQLNKLQNIYYLNNIQKYLQDVQTFMQRLLRVQEKIIDNRKNFMKTLSKEIEEKIVGVTMDYEMKNGSAMTLQQAIDAQFQALQNSLYGSITYAENKNEKFNINQQAKRARIQQAQQKRRKVQHQRQQKQILRRRQMQQKAQQEKMKRQQDKQKLQEKRKNQDQRLRKMKQEREQKDRQKRQQNQKLQQKRKLQLQKKMQQKRQKQAQSKQKMLQEMKKKEQQKKNRQQQDKLRKQRQKKQRQQLEKKKKQQLQTKKQQQDRKKEQQRIRKLQEQKQKQQKLLAEQKRKQDQKKQQEKQKQLEKQRQRIKKQQQLKAKKRQQEQKQKAERQKEQNLKRQREKEQNQRKQKNALIERQRQQKLKKQKLQLQAKQRKQKEQKQLNLKKQRQQRELTEKKERQLRQERQRKDKQEKQKKLKQEKQKKQRQQKQKERIKRQQQEFQREQKIKRQRSQADERQKKAKIQKEKKQKEQKERLQKQKLQKERLQKQKLQKQKLQNQKLQKQRLQKQRLQKQRVQRQRIEKQKRQQELLQKQAKNVPPPKAKPADKGKKGGSGINYNDFDDLDDIIDDDLEQMENASKVVQDSKKVNPTNEYDDYDDDFESPQKQDQEGEADGTHLQTKQLITTQSIKCLNDYMKGTSYSRKNKVNLQPYNNVNQYQYLFEQLIQNRKLFIFDGSMSKALVDFGLQLMKQDVSQDDLRISVQTLRQSIFEEYEKRLQSQIHPGTQLIFPFSFKNDLNIMSIQVVVGRAYFKIVFGKALGQQDEVGRAKLESTIQGLLHIFQIEAEPNIEDYTIPEDSKAVLDTFDKQLPCLLTLFAVYYQKNFTEKIQITQYTVQRFFYSLQVLQPFYQAIQEDQQKISQFYAALEQKYVQNQKIMVYPIQVQSSAQNYQQELMENAMGVKQHFLQSKNDVCLVMYQVFMEAEDEQQQQIVTQKITIYSSIQRVKGKPKPEITYFIVTKDEQQKQNVSALFDMVSEGDDSFDVNVFTDFTRHNGLTQYSDWTLALWARIVQKRKMNALNAFRAITFAMTPYYVVYKQMD